MNDRLAYPQPATAGKLFDAYAPPPDVYDEMFLQARTPRPHWRTFHQMVNNLGVPLFSRRWEQAQRLVDENGIAYSLTRDQRDEPRPWQLDPLPLLLPASDWRVVAEGLRQRARLLNLILADLYGPQQLFRDGLLPPEILFAHPGFLRSYHGQRVAHDRYLHLYAADLARAPDGQWWILADRTEAPSGTGYALENRIVVSRMLPGVFHGCRVERLAPYFVALQETLRSLARSHRDNPRVVLLSQGPQSANFFEDAYLARYLGYTLVEADDLAARNNQITLKTLGGLLPVDVLLRRPNSEACDPLELSTKSAAGVAGMLRSSRDGKVAVANALGSGLVESPVFMAFLPRLCQVLLGEELSLPGVATWWCGDPDSLQLVLDRLDELVIKRAFRHRGHEFAISQKLSNMPREQLVAMLNKDPAAYVAQEQVTRSSTPVWQAGSLRSSHIALRAFLVASDASYTVMDGGLARVSHSSDPLEMSILAGEGSKDVWVLADGPINQISLLQNPGRPLELRRSGAELPSRVADNLYWLGRHMERADAAARLLRTIAVRLTGEFDASGLAEIPPLLRVLAEQGQIEPGFVVEGIRQQLPAVEQALPASVFDTSQPSSLRSVLSEMFRVASIVRDRMSTDTWRIVHRIDEDFRPPAFGGMQLSDTLSLVNELIIELAAFSGMAMESMTRTQGWRFLDLGRRLERALQTTSLIKHTLAPRPRAQSSLLESVLEISESLMTYRSRYLASMQLGAVLDLLLTDETNPRSVAYQLTRLAEHVEKLPREPLPSLYSPEQRLAMEVLHAIRMVDVQSLAELHSLGEKEHLRKLLNEIEVGLPKLSEAISHKFLIHVGPAHQLAEIRPD